MKKIIPHLTIVLSAMCLLFFVIDRFNRNMDFLNNEMTRWLVAALAACAIFTSVRMIIWDLPMNDKEKWKQMHFRQQRKAMAKAERAEAGQAQAAQAKRGLAQTMEQQLARGLDGEPLPDKPGQEEDGATADAFSRKDAEQGK